MCILIAGHLRFQQLTQILNMKTLSKISIPYIGKFSLGSYFRDFADCIRSRENKNRIIYSNRNSKVCSFEIAKIKIAKIISHTFTFISRTFSSAKISRYTVLFFILCASVMLIVKTYANKKTLIEEKYWRTVGSNQLSFPSALPAELLRMIWRADFNFYINCTARYLLIIEYPLVLSRFCSYNSLNLTNPDVFNFRRNNIIH